MLIVNNKLCALESLIKLIGKYQMLLLLGEELRSDLFPDFFFREMLKFWNYNIILWSNDVARCNKDNVVVATPKWEIKNIFQQTTYHYNGIEFDLIYSVRILGSLLPPSFTEKKNHLLAFHFESELTIFAKR